MNAVLRFACPPASSKVLTPLRRAARAMTVLLRHRRARRARLRALQHLLNSDDHILRDIGVTRGDLRMAMNGRRGARAGPLRRPFPAADNPQDPAISRPATLDQLWAAVARGLRPKG